MSDATSLRIAHPDEAVHLIREARATRTLLRLVGGGTRPLSGIPRGREVRVLASAGEWLHHSEDLIVTAPAGMTVAELADRLAIEGQALPLDAPEGGTVGGLVAHGTTGPRLHGRGMPRAWVLGADTVLGSGVPQRIGARVVKNVAGYDAVRLWCGSRGTLGLLLSVTFKVAPAPEAWVEFRQEGKGAEPLSQALQLWWHAPLTWLRITSATPAREDARAWQPVDGLPWGTPLSWSLLAGLEGASSVVRAVSARWPVSGMASLPAACRHRSVGPLWADPDPPRLAWSLAILPSRIIPTLLTLAGWLEPRNAEGRRWAFSGDPGRGRLNVALWGDPDLPAPPIHNWVEAGGGLWQIVAGPGAGQQGPSRTDGGLGLALKRTCDPDDIMNPDALPGCLA
jgi:FAD/FMN-containing dehydrogenase